MGIFDQLKQMVSDKLDDVFGEEPVSREIKSTEEKVITLEYSEDKSVLDVNALKDETKLQPSTFANIVGDTYCKSIEEDKVEEQDVEEEETAAVDVSPMLDLSFDVSKKYESLETQCGCVLFYRDRQLDELYVDDIIKQHTKVDVANPVSAVMTAIGSATADEDETSAYKYFVGISNDKIFNFIYSGYLDEGDRIELRDYLTRRVQQLNVVSFFYIPQSVINLSSFKRVKEFSLILKQRNEKLQYFFTFKKCREDYKRLGQVVDLTENMSNSNEVDESLIELLRQQMYNTLYQQTMRFFKLNEDTVLVLNVCSYAEDITVNQICNEVEFISRGFKVIGGTL